MSLPPALPVDSAWLRYVLEPAARALILAGAAWLLLAAFRVREVSLRLAVWTTILYAALAMPFLSRAVPEISLPLLSPQSQWTDSNGNAGQATVPAGQYALVRQGTDRSAGPESQGAARDQWASPENAGGTPAFSWPAAAIIFYLLVATVLVGRFILGLASARRLRRSCSPVLNERIEELLAREAREAGLRKLPRLAESAALSVPATLGLLRPAILLPVEWNLWSEAETSAVLAHELSHIARRDALTQALSRIYRAFFWFSPLSWWLDRTLADLAEQASDDAALRSGADRVRYAEVLLHFFRSLKQARGRIRWEGVSMAHGSRSERRLERILDSSPLSHRPGLAAMVAVAIAAAPLICLSSALHLTRVGSIPAPVVSVPPPPPMAFLTAPSSDSVQAPAAAASSRASRRLPAETAREQDLWSHLDSNGNVSFAVVSSQSVFGEYSSVADFNHVWELRSRVPGSFLWFRKDGRSYIVRDPAIVKAAIGAFSPLESLEWKQAILNREQGQLLRAQVEVGMRLMAAGFEAPDLAPQLRSIEAQLRAIESAATPEQLSLAQAELAHAEWSAMQALMVQMQQGAEMNREQVRRQQLALYQAGIVLGLQQTELGRQQKQLARQAFALEGILIDQSLLQGLAKPI